MSRYDLTDFKWRVIEPLLPNKPRVDDRRVASRYDRLAANLLAMIQLASMRRWLRAYESTA
jgi:transposase